MSISKRRELTVGLKKKNHLNSFWVVFCSENDRIHDLRDTFGAETNGFLVESNEIYWFSTIFKWLPFRNHSMNFYVRPRK